MTDKTDDKKKSKKPNLKVVKSSSKKPNVPFTDLKTKQLKPTQKSHTRPNARQYDRDAITDLV